MNPDTNYALALFVKSPELSPVKTRLAAGIGEQRALRLYRLCLRAVDLAVDQACRLEPRLRPYYAVAESQGMELPRWRGRARIFQGEGGLGERLASVHRQLAERHHAVLLVGVDLPWLGSGHLLDAIVALESDEMAIGPGLDGGYYLFGARQTLPETVYTGVEYSQADTLAQFRRLLSAHGSISDLPALGDLDQQTDIAALLDVAPRYPNRLQRRLKRALEAADAVPR